MARYLVQRGHEVTVVVVADTRRFGHRSYTWEGVNVIESPDLLVGRMRSGWDPWCTLNRLVHFAVNPVRFDIVHALETRPATLVPSIYARRRQGIPLVTDWIDWWGRGGLIDEQRPWWYRKTLGPVETFFEEHFRASADGLTVISRALAERAQGLGVPKETIEWIPGGADPERFPSLDRDESRRLEGLPADSYLLLFAGLDVVFDLRMVIDSLTHIRHRFPGTRLMVTGVSPKLVRSISREVGFTGDEVIATGYLPDLSYRRHLLAADVCLLPLSDTPANRGRWPNKIGDYLAAGRPVVTTPVGEMRLLLEQYGVGVLVEPSAEGFAKGTIALLSDEACREAKGKEARRVAEQHLSWPALAERLENFYLKTIDRVGMEV